MNVLEHLVTVIRRKPPQPAPKRRRVTNPDALGGKPRILLRRKLKRTHHWTRDEVDLMKVADLLAAAELLGIDIAAVKAEAAGQSDPALMDIPPDWLTEERNHGGINTVSDLLDEICHNEMVDFPDAKVARDVQIATIIRLLDGRLSDAFDLAQELADLTGDEELREQLGKLLTAAAGHLPPQKVDASAPMVPWSQ